MQLKENLSHIDYLQVTDSNSSEIFCGSDQEWFPTERQRLTGCGPSAAANILFYIDRKDNSGCCGRNRTDLLSFMEEAWQSVTPGKDGIPSTAIFLEKVEQYAKLHGKAFHYFVLNIPTQQSERPSLSTVTEFIRQGLRTDIPIAFLNLDHGKEENLESWHWVTIAGLDSTDNDETVYISICDEGIEKQIDLKLWLETTVQGGGFVYFLPSTQENRIEKAKENHRSGYNCSQAVACAYCDKVGIEEPFMYQMMEGFGLGMGSMEGTCGALSGAIAIASLKVCQELPEGSNQRAAVYKAARTIIHSFKEKNQSVICKELKGVETGTVLRDCRGCVEDAAAILEATVFPANKQ